MRRAGHVARMGKEERSIRDFGGKPLMEGDHLEDLGEAGGIILKWIFNKYSRWCVVD